MKNIRRTLLRGQCTLTDFPFPNQIAHRYRIVSQLGSGGMGAVYRAFDRLTGQTIALKRVTAPTQDILINSRTVATTATDVMLGFAMEFRTLAGLRHPHIVSVLDYGFDAGRQPYFTMQLIERGRTLTKAGEGLGERGKVKLLVGTLQALAYLHRRGIIHRDLKPANVLVTPDRQAKVMDFGLALNLSQSSKTPFTGVVGTITYMAPEILTDNGVSVQSDLYAVGVMAYEMFLGTHPFDTRNVGALVTSVLRTKPDVSGLSDELGEALRRLLARKPEARYESADDAIAALCKAVRLKIPREDAVLRDSFLQAANFVGRDPELKTLLEGLNRALRPVIPASINPAEPPGNDEPTKPSVEREAQEAQPVPEPSTPEPYLWLVGGESGVGKSRLLDELRTRALVSGILVLRGQAVEGGGLPYQMWREPLRRLALSTPLSDLEAGILKPVIPDIAALLERPIADVPPLEGRSDMQRLALTIAQIFARQASSVLLMLEDLQWAVEQHDFEPAESQDEDRGAMLTVDQNLAPLHQLRLLAETASTPTRLMIVASYRDDERPDLPTRFGQDTGELPGDVRVMKLERLTTEAIHELTKGMLGEKGAQPDIISFLQRETEGNALFLIEVVRELAESVGRLANIAEMTLPQHIFAGGMLNVVKRRLARVPEDYHDLLQFAAVVGRELDIRLLSTQHEALNRRASLAISPDSDSEASGIGVDVARNAQDAEAALDAFLTACANAAVLEVSDDHWRFAHDKIREAIQADLSSEAKAALHRRVALSIEHIYPTDDADRIDMLMLHWTAADDPERQLHYTVLSARRLIDLSAEYGSAIHQLKRALALTETHTELEPSQISIFNLLGDAYRNQGSYPQAADHYERALALAEKLDDRPGQANALRGRGVVARWQGDTAVAVDCSERAMALFRALDDVSGVARCLNTLGNIARAQGNFDRARACFTQSLDMRRQAGDKRGIAASLFHLGTFAYYQGDYAEAHDYYSQSLVLREEIKDQQGIAASLRSLGNAADSQKDHAAAHDHFKRALEIQRKIDDRPGVAASLFSLGSVAYRQGDHAAACDYFTQSLTMRRGIGDRQGLVTTLFHRAAAYTARCSFDEAQRDLVESLVTAQETDSPSQAVESVAVFGKLLLARGDTTLAAEVAGLAEAHPALTAFARDTWLEPLVADLAGVLPGAELDEAMRRGQALTLETVLPVLLATVVE